MSDEKKLSASRSIDASAAEIFDVLSNPHRHVELDTSGFVRSLAQGDRIKQVGDVFTMNMEGDHMGGEYQTDNHINGFAKDKLIAWQTAPAGTEPPGWEWVYELDAQGPEQTEVTLTYDWSKVTDKELLAKNLFPLISQEELDASLAKLAEAVSS
ncbi:SRPBCC family protein [Branchiibius cervicis]|uniref:SRPBCC family protein n=1 Tax=Branchiibius cervicis TaxID=908252 RepID=A0ABW2AWU7_9MICO